MSECAGDSDWSEDEPNWAEAVEDRGWAVESVRAARQQISITSDTSLRDLRQKSQVHTSWAYSMLCASRKTVSCYAH